MAALPSIERRQQTCRRRIFGTRSTRWLYATVPLDPTRGTGGRSPVRPYAGSVADAVARVEGIGQVIHVRVLPLRAWISRPRHRSSLRDTLSLSCSYCLAIDVPYSRVMPRLWTETIEAHRRAVRDAILDTTAARVAEHGLTSVTMSQIAEETGIGRATLYKYFSDVEAILVAWHERQIAGHLEHLARVRDQTGDPGQRLEAVLQAYASISHQHHGSELAAVLHRGEHVARARRHLRDFIRDLLTDGARTGDIRDGVAPDELASYCLHALAAANDLPSKAAVRRLVTVILTGLRSPRLP
jgi:AcrR family transcriptional regulator